MRVTYKYNSFNRTSLGSRVGCFFKLKDVKWDITAATKRMIAPYVKTELALAVGLCIVSVTRSDETLEIFHAKLGVHRATFVHGWV